jgi:glycosyltransferase involved in cell wall biosynthesis
VCDADAEYYRSLANDPSKIKIFRNAIDVKAYEAAVPPPPNHRRPNLVMTGSYYSRESPMVRGARWIAREVFPRLMQQIPGLHLYLVGKGSDEFLKDIVSENVTAAGKVEATLPYLKHADVALAPLLFEAAGTKFKVLEAAICGVPIVASPVGGEGLPQGYSKHVVTCASADEFVSAIVGIFRNKGVEQGNQLQEFRARVAADFGLEQLARDAAGILRALDT